MWTRKELKDKAKVAFKANYWKAVLVSLVLLVVAGGLSVASSAYSAPPAAFVSSAPVASTSSSDNVNVEIKDGKVTVDVDDGRGGKVNVNMDADDIDDLRDAIQGSNAKADGVDASRIGPFVGPGVVFAGLTFGLVMLIVVALAIALYVFIISPLEVGAQRFFVRNLNQPSEVKEVAFGYDNNYKEIVKTLFLRSLFIFLWSLLLIIPGIYKAYQYRMIPYLLAEDPAMTKDQAFAETKRMMDGQKWNTFVLDLSFIGWGILSALTLGILGVFYVGPYQAQTNAALYEKLRYGLPAPEPVAQPVASVPAASAANRTASQVAVPVIVSESQPPVPPFAQVGAQPQANVDATSPMPPSAPSTTAPIPETGIDPTAEMPGVAGNGANPDSPKA